MAAPIATIDGVILADGPFDVIRLGATPAAALASGTDMLRQTDPLLIVPLDPADPSAGAQAADLLREAGFDLYHHLAGFEVAVPLDVGFLDDFTMNLIACRPSRAAELATRGLLLTRSDVNDARAAHDRDEAGPPAASWPQQLAQISSCLIGDDPPASRIVLAERLAVRWLGRLRDFVDLIDRPARLIVLIRLLAACGARVAALEAMRPLLHRLEAGRLALDEPAIAIAPAFDPPVDSGPPCPAAMSAPGEPSRLALSIIDTMCRMIAHTSFIAGEVFQPTLAGYRDAGCCLPPQLERRRQLMARRSGHLDSLEPTPGLLGSRNARLAVTTRRAG